MSPESYENEPKEKIDACLNCTLPPEFCHGKGDCMNREIKRINRSLDEQILELVHAGHRQPYIAQTLGVSKTNLWQMMNRIRKNGLLTEEEERRVFPRSHE